MKNELIKIENYTNEKFDNQLKELDEGYRTNFIKYSIITSAMAKTMEMSGKEQKQLAMYLLTVLIIKWVK